MIQFSLDAVNAFLYDTDSLFSKESKQVNSPVPKFVLESEKAVEKALANSVLS